MASHAEHPTQPTVKFVYLVSLDSDARGISLLRACVLAIEGLEVAENGLAPKERIHIRLSGAFGCRYVLSSLLKVVTQFDKLDLN